MMSTTSRDGIRTNTSHGIGNHTCVMTPPPRYFETHLQLKQRRLQTIRYSITLTDI